MTIPSVAKNRWNFSPDRSGEADSDGYYLDRGTGESPSVGGRFFTLGG